MEITFRMESSAGCWTIVSLLVVTTKVAAPDVDAPDEDGTAAQDDLHQQFININIIQKLDSIEPLCSKSEEANGVNSVLDCADLALVILQVHRCFGPSISPIRCNSLA